MSVSIRYIISGGQTGVDRAALDFAIEHRIDHGGWCPAGRLAADGVLDDRYWLKETDSSGYSQRTKRNVQDSDGTLILYRDMLEGGSLLTRRLALKLGKPFLELDLTKPAIQHAIAWRDWLEDESIVRLNVAGPSERRCPGVYLQALELLGVLWGFIPCSARPARPIIV